MTAIRSRRLATSPIRLPEGSTSTSAASSLTWKVPLAGETTIRQVGELSISANSPCLSQNARASSSWSGPLSANVSTPRSARLAIPVRVPAGGISRMPVTPRSAKVSMHRSQRTGLAIWPTIRRSTSTPSWTTWPSRLETKRVRGSCTDTERASEPRCPTAGSMWWVWNAPATLSGASRAFAGGSSASAWSCAMVPAATTWPGPLLLAGVRPCFSIVASTSSGSPPRIAVIPVSVTAAASAIALPRSRTRTMACSAVITRAPAAAVSSPTECPATALTLPNASVGCGKIPSAATSPVATSSGWAISVRRISSASATVP